MKILVFLISLVLLSGSLYCQDSENDKVVKIDSLVSVIDKNIESKDYYNKIEGSGQLKQKVGGIIPMHVGSQNHTTYFNEDTICCIARELYYELDNKTVNESFYYYNNVLIRYDKEVTTEENGETRFMHKITAYYQDYLMLKYDSDIKDGYIFNKSEQLKVTKDARERLSVELDLINN